VLALASGGFVIQICVFFIWITRVLCVFHDKMYFYATFTILNNFGHRKTLDRVESFRLTPASSGSDGTTIYFWDIQSDPKRCASHGPPSARESRAMRGPARISKTMKSFD
jgi:hypothetical protein